MEWYYWLLVVVMGGLVVGMLVCFLMAGTEVLIYSDSLDKVRRENKQREKQEREKSVKNEELF